jgi:hypothetical protein
MLLPDTVTGFPPATDPDVELSVMPAGAVGGVPAAAEPANPGLPSVDDAVATVPDAMAEAVTPEAVTIPSMVMAGSEEPAANGVELSVQVIT